MGFKAGTPLIDAVVLLNLTALGGPFLDRYWPLNSVDSWLAAWFFSPSQEGGEQSVLSWLRHPNARHPLQTTAMTKSHDEIESVFPQSPHVSRLHRHSGSCTNRASLQCRQDRKSVV